MKRQVWINIILLMVSIGLTVFNIVLQHRLRDLSTRNAELQANQAPLPGSVVPYIVGYDLAHHPIRIDCAHQSGRTLLLLLSPRCHYCENNWVYWRRLIAEAHGVKIVVGDISGEVTPEYFSNLGIPIPDTVIQIDPVMRMAYNFNAVPETILLGSKGEVIDVWIGTLTDKSVATLTNRFFTSL